MSVAPPPVASVMATDPYASPDKVPARVEVVNRPMRDKYALGIFVVVLLVNLVLGIMVAGGVKDAKGLATDYNTCVKSISGTPEQPLVDVEAAGAAQAQVAAISASALGSISFDGIAKNPGVIAGLSVAVLFVAGLWVYLLYRYTKAMVWGTLVFNVVIVAALALYLFTVPGGMSAGAIYAAVAAIMALALVCLKNNVNMAAGLLNLAMQCLKEYPSLIIAAIATNLIVLLIYIIQMVFILQAFLNIGFTKMTASTILSMENRPSVPLAIISGQTNPAAEFCVPGQTSISMFGRYFFAATLLWMTFTMEAVRMAICATVFGAFYFFAPEDPARPKSIVCAATAWAFTKQLGTHVISGFVLAAIDQLKRMAKSRSGGIAGLIIRIVILCILSLIEQLTKFLVVMSGLTGLSFWDSAKRTMTVMKEAFVDGYVTSKITTRVLRLSGYVFALAFGILTWAIIDASSFQDMWWFSLIILIGIIFPIAGIVLALVLSTLLASLGQTAGCTSCENPLAGPLAGLFFGSIAHAVMLFMEQLILDLVDAAFMCFALDAHNHVISPRGEVVHRFMNASFADQLSDSCKEATKLPAEGVPNPAVGMVPPQTVAYPVAPPPGAGAHVAVASYPGAPPPGRAHP
jgi:hypothetical protein